MKNYDIKIKEGYYKEHVPLEFFRVEVTVWDSNGEDLETRYVYVVHNSLISKNDIIDWAREGVRDRTFFNRKDGEAIVLMKTWAESSISSIW